MGARVRYRTNLCAEGTRLQGPTTHRTRLGAGPGKPTLGALWPGPEDDSPWEAEQGWHMAGKVIHFGAAVTAQQLPTIETHSTEVLVLYGGWGALLGSQSSGNESVFFRRCTIHLQWPLPSRGGDSDLSSPQTRALGGIRQAVLADLGEEVSLSSWSTVLANGGRGEVGGD